MFRLILAGLVVARQIRRRMCPSLRKPWPYDARQQFRNCGITDRYEVSLNGKIAPNVVAASPQTGHILQFKTDRNGRVISRKRPCSCKPGMHDSDEQAAVCWPYEIVRGSVTVRNLSTPTPK